MSFMNDLLMLWHNWVAQTGLLQKVSLRVMGVQGLTIYHVKSHLQKYRLATYLPDSSSEGKTFNQKEVDDMLPSLDGSSGMQITEALKLQMEVQKKLHEQLEVQRQLQLRIEAQGKYLKKIIDEQERLGGVLLEVAPTIEDKTTKEHTLHRSLSVDELFHEQITQDSSRNTGPPKVVSMKEQARLATLQIPESSYGRQ